MKGPFLLPCCFSCLKCRISLPILWAANIFDIHCTFNYSQAHAYGNSYDVVLKEQMETASNAHPTAVAKANKFKCAYNNAVHCFEVDITTYT